eukprot:gb/GECH01003171.1/.p1 GENE.gb/GECH01003171.1/~~gb/GECH01003171.1/.p1  ORF type:complete len:113 (+),score=26.96 gb/GECH01003171.1/:1-339(+)
MRTKTVRNSLNKGIELNFCTAMDMGGTSDPYVSVTTSANPSSGTKTEVKKKELNPKWNASLDIPVEDPSSEKLMVEVFDWDRMKGDGIIILDLFIFIHFFLIKFIFCFIEFY